LKNLQILDFWQDRTTRLIKANLPVCSVFHSEYQIAGKWKIRVCRKPENQKTRKPEPEPEPETLQAEICREVVGQKYLEFSKSVCRFEFALSNPIRSDLSVSVLENFIF
jgi:hypothetical protein